MCQAKRLFFCTKKFRARNAHNNVFDYFFPDVKKDLADDTNNVI